MGPISTPKVIEKGTILRPLAPPIDPKEPLWRSKGAQRSHCEGLGRLKWSPKAHFDGFGVPRCPKKLHFYYTDAQNWPQGLHFEGFGLDFAYSHVFFECVCVTFLLFTVFVFFGTAMLSLQPPSTGIRSKSRHHQQKPTTAAKQMLPAEPASPAKTGTASIIGTTRRIQQNQHHMQTQASPAEANVTSRSHHNQHHHQDQTRQAASAVPAETSRTSSTSRRQHQQQSQFRQQKPPQN